MNISLTPHLEAFVNERVASGKYATASEVIREGLRLLAEQDNQREWTREEVMQEIQKGLDDIEAGRVVEIHSKEQFLELFSKKIKVRNG